MILDGLSSGYLELNAPLVTYAGVQLRIQWLLELCAPLCFVLAMSVATSGLWRLASFGMEARASNGGLSMNMGLAMVCLSNVGGHLTSMAPRVFYGTVQLPWLAGGHL